MREFSVMTFMPKGGACFDEAVQARLDKYGIGSAEFMSSLLRLAAKRIRYLADRGELQGMRRRQR